MMAAPRAGSDLPGNVSSAFSQKYPAAKLGNWEMYGDDYIITFIDKDVKSSAYFPPDGAWLRTDTRIESKEDLPAAVRDGLARSRFAGYDIDKIEKIQQPSDRTYYIVRVDYGAHLDYDLHDVFVNDYLLYFSSNGTLQETVGHVG
jgi:hypothetical protein